MSMFLVSLVSAEISSSSGECSIGSVKQGDTIELTQVCRGGCTIVNLTKVMFPNQSVALLGQFPMSENGSNYNFTFSNTNTLGTYTYDVEGVDPNSIVVGQTCSFEVTPNGFDIPDSGILYSVLLIILFLFDLLIFYIIFMLDSENPRNESTGEFIGVSLQKYIRMFLIGISYGLVILTLNLMNAVAQNLSGFSQFAGIIGGLFLIMLGGAFAWSMGITIWIFITIIKDGNFIKEIKKQLEEVDRII